MYFENKSEVDVNQKSSLWLIDDEPGADLTEVFALQTTEGVCTMHHGLQALYTVHTTDFKIKFKQH